MPDSYRQLKVWQAAMDLVVQCYTITSKFPANETFGLTSQIRRAAISVPANIAEGHGRANGGDFTRFLQIAQGSLKELETHLLISERVGICAMAVIEPVLAESDKLGRMVLQLQRAQHKGPAHQPPRSPSIN